MDEHCQERVVTFTYRGYPPNSRASPRRYLRSAASNEPQGFTNDDLPATNCLVRWMRPSSYTNPTPG